MPNGMDHAYLLRVVPATAPGPITTFACGCRDRSSSLRNIERRWLWVPARGPGRQRVQAALLLDRAAAFGLSAGFFLVLAFAGPSAVEAATDVASSSRWASSQ